jgi:shikimate kinase
MNPASKLILVGPMGAGKSTIGRRLAEHYELPFVDLDHEIERRCGVGIPLIFELEQEPGFRRREHGTLAAVLREGDCVLATGGGTVLDPDNREALRTHGFVVWLQATVDEQLDRLARDRSRPLLRTDDRRARLEALATARTPLYAEVCDLAFAGGHATPAVAARRLAEQLDARWTRRSAA